MPLLFSILLITLLLWFNAIDLLTTGSKLFIVESWRLGYAKLIKCLIEIGSFAINDNFGLEPLQSSIIANLAAGRVFEEIGVFPINVDALKEISSHHNKMD